MLRAARTMKHALRHGGVTAAQAAKGSGIEIDQGPAAAAAARTEACLAALRTACDALARAVEPLKRSWLMLASLAGEFAALDVDGAAPALWSFADAMDMLVPGHWG